MRTIGTIKKSTRDKVLRRDKLFREVFGNNVSNEYRPKTRIKKLGRKLQRQNVEKLKLTNKIQERRIQVNKQLNNTWSYGKIGRLLASIILPVIMFIGIGMSIGTFHSAVQDGDITHYTITPFEKGLGLLNIVKNSGTRFKNAINIGIDWDNEEVANRKYTDITKEEAEEKGYKVLNENEVNLFSTKALKKVKQFGMICWYMIKEPILITLDCVNYLIN